MLEDNMKFINDYDGKESAKAQVKILAAFQKKTDLIWVG